MRGRCHSDFREDGRCVHHPRATCLNLSQNISLTSAGQRNSCAVWRGLLKAGSFYLLSPWGKHQPGSWDSRWNDLIPKPVTDVPTETVQTHSLGLCCWTCRVRQAVSPRAGYLSFSRLLLLGRACTSQGKNGLHGCCRRGVWAREGEVATELRFPGHHCFFPSSPSASHPSPSQTTPPSLHQNLR